MKLIGRFKNLATISLLMAVFYVAISLLSGIRTLAEIKLFYDGVVSFKADHDIISFDNGVIGLVYDTSECPGCKDTLPEWRYIGDLKIDSIVYLDSVIAYDDSTKSNDIAINSTGLLNVLKDANTYRLMQRSPWFNPADTLYWDSIFQEFRILNDLSIYYEFYFNDTLNIDTVSSWLNNVSDVQGLGGIPIYYDDVVDCPLGIVGWTPNDFNDQWHLGPKKEVIPGFWQWGINAECAWGLFDTLHRGYDGNYLAIIEANIDTNNSDLWKVSLATDFPASAFSGHSTGVTGIAVAEASNYMHFCGVAPDACAVVFNKNLNDANAISYIIDYDNNPYGAPSAILFAKSSRIYDPYMHVVLGNAKDQHIPFITSSGDIRYNDPEHPDTGPYPSYPSAWDDLCISVGAYGPNGQWMYWSNYTCDSCDPQVDVLAPGQSISTVDVGDTVGSLTGTSAAAPIVAGMIMLAKSYRYDLIPSQLEDILENTADTTYSGYDPIKYGAGNVDLLEFMLEVKNTTASKIQSGSDSIPCLIITNFQCRPTLEALALEKTKRGTKTVIEPIEIIAGTYGGNDLAEKIRACIDYYADNKYTEYVILGGDESIIPYRYAYNDIQGPGVQPICDYYFACLDGDWNYDDDDLYGEVEDSVDLIPEVSVGRLPFSSPVEFQNFLNKLEDYETNPSSSWRTDAMFAGSKMFSYADGKAFCQDLKEDFPVSYSFTEMYDDTGGTASKANYIQEFNEGKGFVVQYGLACSHFDFIVKEHGWRELINIYDVDTLLINYRQPSVIFSATCWNENLDQDCMAEHYMNLDSAGAVAYIGQTYNDYIYRSYPVMKEFFGLLFGDGPKEIGKLLDSGKAVIREKSQREGSYRHTTFGYNLLGDPQMRIWTAEPENLAMDCPDTLQMGFNNFDVKIEEYTSGNPVESALVCISNGGTSIYDLQYTDENGRAWFYNVEFPSASNATVKVTKHNYFALEDQIVIADTTGGGGCPMLYVYNGTAYLLNNNILAQSEDPDLCVMNNTDCYPIYNIAPTSSNTVKMQIREDESEKSFIDQVSLSYVGYPVAERVVYTNKAEFRYLSSDSLMPFAVFDSNGNNIIDQFGGNDGSGLNSIGPGYLIFEYYIESGLGKINDGGGGGIEPPPGGKDPHKLHAGESTLDESNNVIISVLEAEDNWVEVNTLYPRINAIDYFTDLSDYLAGDELTVKIEWERDISINCLPFYFFEGVPIEQVESGILSALHNEDGNVQTEIALIDNQEITLSPNEYLDFEFGPIIAQPEHEIAAVFKAHGRYRSISFAGQGLNGFSFEQNYPNPFNPATTFSFSLPKSVSVNLSIYNILGRKVVTVIDEVLTAGKHEITWAGNDSNGNKIASGIYFAKFTAGDYSVSRKMMIVK